MNDTSGEPPIEEWLRQARIHAGPVQQQILALNIKIWTEQVAHERTIAALQDGYAAGQRALDELERRLLPAPEPAPEQVRERHAVKDAVMDCLRDMPGRDPRTPWYVSEIATCTGLPAGSIHAFLLKARRDGKVQRTADDRWRLPQSAGEPVQQEAADG